MTVEGGRDFIRRVKVKWIQLEEDGKERNDFHLEATVHAAVCSRGGGGGS